MIDFKLPVIPGVGAAGIAIGMNINSVISEMQLPTTVENLPDDSRVYRSDAIDFWVRNNTIYQIMLHGSFPGTFHNGIGVGSRVEDVKKQLGPLELDDEDNLVVKHVNGLSFELDPESNPPIINEIYIFAPERS